MEPNVQDALQAKANAERKFAERDYVSAKNNALRAQMLCPHLEGIAQMVATFGVHSAAEMKVNGEYDFYTILGMDPSANRAKLKKQYKRMAVLLHPDKNKNVGADGAFRLVSEAWTVLSDRAKRSAYDQRRNVFTLHTSGVGNYANYSNSPAPHGHGRLDTFWTVCTSCQVQYEYHRKYVNKRLSCKNCRGVFIAVETGLAPVNGSYAFSPWPYVPENGYKSHGCGVTYVPTSSPAYSANNSRVPGHHGSEHVSNLSFQWSSSFPGTSAGVIDPNGSSTGFSFIQQANTKASGRKANGKKMVADGSSVGSDQLPRRPGRPPKNRKIEMEISTRGYSNGEVASKAAAEVIMADGNGNENLKRNGELPTPEVPTRRWPMAPAFDPRPLLIDKARTDIRKKLEEITLAEAERKRKAAHATQYGESSERPKREGLGIAAHQSTGSMTMTVPDSDFHDFDKDRSEDCFKPKQIWALYDEEDGMPRLYCLIRQVISVQPFKVHISYLSSKTDSEFGLVNWLYSGFTKSCGKFRAFNSEVIEQVNIFSHLLSREKAGRGGCVQIYPKSGDIWAIYRNWSPDWNRKTADEVRHHHIRCLLVY
ncbi:hypothetical protein RND71_008543 [Anisodus tanguticus]|uniref:J domain-containing protein n=1 Tax=Anisodus tanguticus TaxID=243964 RepID=A0AAE1SNW2_9SOLA|nr:hypothetical protein RND71_008543 [Anisodus tanguticus]